MRLNGIRPVWRRKFVHTTDSKHTMTASANVLNRRLEQALPNQVWVCDITYSLRTCNYLGNCKFPGAGRSDEFSLAEHPTKRSRY